MKFGVNSLLFTDTFLEKDLPLLEHCHTLGFDTIEISPVEPDRFPVRKVRDLATSLGMTVNVNFALPDHANPMSPDAAVRAKSVDLSKRIIDLCNETGATVYGGSNYCSWRYFTGKRRTDDEWRWGIESMRAAGEYAQSQSDLVIAVETLNRFESYFLNTAADAARFVDAVGLLNVKVHLDTFHMMYEEDDIGEAIRGCGTRLAYFHACGSQRGIPGRDLVPWQVTFEALRDVGYDFCITIESFNPHQSIAPLAAIWRDFADSPEQLATEGLRFVRETYERVYGRSSRDGRPNEEVAVSP
jgi:D-psicose/D-tagatose/L-ribulose 3-epimerase